MKINITDKPKMVKVKSIGKGECFKYWPDISSSPSSYRVCMRTDGRFCIEDCKNAWPIRFVDLTNGDECGTSVNTMVEPLSLQVMEN